MDELGKVMSQSAGILIPVPDNGLAGNDTEMHEQRSSEGSYQRSGRSEAGLVDLRDWDVERGEGRDLV